MCPEDDIEQAWSKWEKNFMDVMHQCIPTVTVKVNRNPPWLTHDLLVAIEHGTCCIGEHVRQGRKHTWSEEKLMRLQTC